MEAEKRKPAGNEVASRRQKHMKAPAVNEDEVEEFVAIIRNIQMAVSYFKNADVGGESKFLDGGLRAMLESCNEEADGVKGKAKTKKKENVDFDLNAEPKPEYDLY